MTRSSLLVPCLALGTVLSIHAQTTPSITPVDNNVTGYGTFQSHNQKVVSTAYGIFMTYAKTTDPNVTWRLMRSTDGGASFVTLWEATHFTRPPALEAASDGTLYLVYSNPVAPLFPAYVYRLAPTQSFSPQLIATLSGAAAQKFSLLIDQPRGFLYYSGQTFETNNPLRFVRMSLDGSVLASYQLTGNETVSRASYPNLLVSDGLLYLAWTTGLIGGDNDDYYSIHVVRSPDGGTTWQNLAGATLTPPFVSDHNGPSTEVTVPFERPCITWLWSFAVARGKAHFVYRRYPNASEPACSSGPHAIRYRRFDVATGAVEADDYSFAPAGVPFDNLDGFFSTSPRDGTIFLTSKTSTSRLTSVVSTDAGASWSKVSESAPLPDVHYAIGGQRQVTVGSKVVGSYTDFSVAPQIVKFFQSAVLPVPTQPIGKRLAATLSANAQAPGYPIQNANDSNAATVWVANLVQTPSNNNAWVQLDLGVTKFVARVRYTTAYAPYPANGPSDYTVQASIDGTIWRTVAAFSAADGWLASGDIVVDGAARYLKLTTTRVNDGTGWALGFAEIWAEGSSYSGDDTAPLPASIMVNAQAPGYPAANAIDNNLGTIWVANLATPPSNNNAWARLDVGSVKRVTRLRWESGVGVPYPASGPADYSVETSIDGVNYVPAVSRTNPGAIVTGDEILDRNARFVRLTTTKVNDGTGWSLSFKEIWVE